MSKRWFYWLFLVALLLASCQGPAETEVVIDPAAVATPLPTDIPETATPLPAVGVLLTPAGSDPALVAELNTLIGGYIRDLGLRYQVLTDLTEADFQRDEIQLVVILPPFPRAMEIVQLAPATRFLAVGFNDLAPTENLSVLRSGGGDFGIQGFAAGYIAAMITDDWRVGALSVQENPDALAARDGFRVGVKYYCGLCNPKYAPTGINYVYPKYIDLPADATELQVNANIDFLVDRAVKTFYIVPGVGTPNIYRTLVGYKKWIIGSGTDFKEEYKDYWVASLEYDQLAALIEAWPEFLAAETGFEKSPPLLLTDINYDLLSEGKVQMVEKVLAEAAAGFIALSYDQ